MRSKKTFKKPNKNFLPSKKKLQKKIKKKKEKKISFYHLLYKIPLKKIQ